MYLGDWLLSLQRADGGHYELDTITAFHRGIDRHLRSVSYKYSLISSVEFDMSHRVLKSKKKDLE